eukprot:4956654-Alexandrium_andersonii.AAC.1
MWPASGLGVGQVRCTQSAHQGEKKRKVARCPAERAAMRPTGGSIPADILTDSQWRNDEACRKHPDRH